MAYTLDVSEAEHLSLEDYAEHVDRSVDLRDVSSIAESAWALARLSNNKELLINAIHKELLLARNKLVGSMYTPQSMILHRGEGYVVRANIWVQPSTEPKRRALEIPVYSYHSAHDHNFDFLTVGYFGSGYETEIYEYDRQSVEGIPNEPVDLRLLERTKLPRGKVMMFRASTDVHTQLPPEDLSISLNLLVQDKTKLKVPQLFFDTSRGRISHYAEDANTQRVAMLAIAARLANGRTIELLHEFATTHECPRTRAAAYASLLHACPDDREALLAEALNDGDRSMARRVEGLIVTRQQEL